MLPQRLHAAAGLTKKKKGKPDVQAFKKACGHVKTLVLKPKAWCYLHGQECELVTADVHVAGTACQDHSSIGANKQEDGVQQVTFIVWIAARRRLREKCILHENVPRFGTKQLIELLGDLYVVNYSRVNACDYGTPMQRPRQYCLLVLKDWIYPQLPEQYRNESAVRHLLDFEHTVAACFRATTAVSFRDFAVFDPESIEREKAVLSQRPEVLNRWRLIGQGKTTTINKGGELCQLYADDPPNSCLACLLPAERRRFDDYVKLWPGSASDLTQEPEARAITTRRSNWLMTILRNNGVIMHHDKHGSDHKFIPSEDILRFMGWAVYPQDQEVAGFGCPFAPGNSTPPPATRDVMALKQQAGNGMYVGNVGAALAITILKMPALGERGERGNNMGPSSSKRQNQSQSPGSGSKNEVNAFTAMFREAAQSRSAGSSLKRWRN